MAPQPPGVYLIVEFDWPQIITKEMSMAARALHDALQGKQTWIRETVAASNGVGSGPSSLWIFWLENYAALDSLIPQAVDPISGAFHVFFSHMQNVKQSLRDEVIFL